MRILLTGAGGLLGSHLTARLSRRHEVFGTDRHPWWGRSAIRWIPGDLQAPGFIPQLIRDSRPDGVIHCAALTNVDACEKSPALAYAVNADVTRDLARAVPADAWFLYLSTDGIFRGDHPLAKETDPPCPKTVYGRSKLQGEWEVQLHARAPLIVRTNFYGWSSGRKQTFAEWLYQALVSRRPITLFQDFFFSPLYVVHLAQCIEALIEGGHRGVFHIGGKERVSKSDFGLLMAQLADILPDQIRLGSLEEAALLAQRPRDMSLDNSHFVQKTGMGLPSVREGLELFLKQRTETPEARVDHDFLLKGEPASWPSR